MCVHDYLEQVLADEGMAKSIAFDEIDKAPEEKQRGITIATVSSFAMGNTSEPMLFCNISSLSLFVHKIFCLMSLWLLGK